jgi:hypothetical protein
MYQSKDFCFTFTPGPAKVRKKRASGQTWEVVRSTQKKAYVGSCSLDFSILRMKAFNSLGTA